MQLKVSVTKQVSEIKLSATFFYKISSIKEITVTLTGLPETLPDHSPSVYYVNFPRTDIPDSCGVFFSGDYQQYPPSLTIYTDESWFIPDKSHLISSY